MWEWLLLAALAGFAGFVVWLRYVHRRGKASYVQGLRLETKTSLSRKSNREPASVDAMATGPDLGTCFARGLSDRLRLVYTDRDGAMTSRDVSVEEVWGRRGDKAGYVWVNWLVGYCHMRQERRHFSVGSINEVSEAGSKLVATGGHIEPWLANRFGVKPSQEQLAFRRDHPTERQVNAPPVVVQHIAPGGSQADTFEMEIDLVEAYADGTLVRIEGRARRAAAAGRRAWSGRKVLRHDYFGARIVSIALAATGEDVPDPISWLAGLPDAH
jgi:hypothetical protein